MRTFKNIKNTLIILAGISTSATPLCTASEGLQKARVSATSAVPAPSSRLWRALTSVASSPQPSQPLAHTIWGSLSRNVQQAQAPSWLSPYLRSKWAQAAVAGVATLALASWLIKQSFDTTPQSPVIDQAPATQTTLPASVPEAPVQGQTTIPSNVSAIRQRVRTLFEQIAVQHPMYVVQATGDAAYVLVLSNDTTSQDIRSELTKLRAELLPIAQNIRADAAQKLALRYSTDIETILNRTGIPATSTLSERTVQTLLKKQTQDIPAQTRATPESNYLRKLQLFSDSLRLTAQGMASWLDQQQIPLSYIMDYLRTDVGTDKTGAVEGLTRSDDEVIRDALFFARTAAQQEASLTKNSELLAFNRTIADLKKQNGIEPESVYTTVRSTYDALLNSLVYAGKAFDEALKTSDMDYQRALAALDRSVVRSALRGYATYKKYNDQAAAERAIARSMLTTA